MSLIKTRTSGVLFDGADQGGRVIRTQAQLEEFKKDISPKQPVVKSKADVSWVPRPDDILEGKIEPDFEKEILIVVGGGHKIHDVTRGLGTIVVDHSAQELPPHDCGYEAVIVPASEDEVQFQNSEPDINPMIMQRPMEFSFQP